MTLPERILRKLESINKDRCRAIVKCVEAVTGEGDHAFKPVELVEVTPGKVLIVVGPSSSLAQIPWLRLVEITPARHLLTIPSGTPIEALELALHDLLDSLAPHQAGERALLTELRNIIGHQRRGKKVSKAELLFIDVPSKA